MRFLYFDWPHLAYRIEASRLPARRPDGTVGTALVGQAADELVVIGGQPWEPGAALDCSPAARRLGVTRGQPLGTAHRLVPEAQFLAADVDSYRTAMDAALDVLA